MWRFPSRIIKGGGISRGDAEARRENDRRNGLRIFGRIYRIDVDFGMVMRILVLLAILALSLVGCRPSSEGPPYFVADSHLISREHNIYCQGFHPEDQIASDCFTLTQTYRVGMSRKDVRALFGQWALKYSVSRPAKGWSSLEDAQYHVRKDAACFEQVQVGSAVASCEVYEFGGGGHTLFFGDNGILLGFEQYPYGLCYYA